MEDMKKSKKDYWHQIVEGPRIIPKAVGVIIAACLPCIWIFTWKDNTEYKCLILMYFKCGTDPTAHVFCKKRPVSSISVFLPSLHLIFKAETFM